MTNWKKNGPVVIGGMGGSGTRLVAEICSIFGIYLGDDLNIASDNLLYTLLFRRQSWFYKSYQDHSRVKPGLSLLEKLLLKEYRLSLSEIWFLLYAVTDMTLHYRDERIWSLRRMIKIIQNPRFKTSDYLGWGWKEPNSYLLLRNLAEHFDSLKFIHMIRHGADMAFSRNQRQMRAWGEIFGIPAPANEDEIPPAALKFWARANQTAADVGRRLGSDHYLQINFDNLCKNPSQMINDIISFLELEIDQEQYRKAVELPQIPSSMGRYKQHDLSQFDREDLETVRSFGFTIEPG